MTASPLFSTSRASFRPTSSGRRVRTLRLQAALAALLVSGLVASALEGQALQSFADEPVRLWQDGRGWAVVDLGDGREVPLSESQARYTSVWGSRTGGPWWVAGSEPTRTGGQELVLWRGDSEAVRQSLPTKTGPGRVRTHPVLLGGEEGVEGLVWLQGESPVSFHVMAAEYNGEAFAAGEMITGPGPGSQVALDAAVLEDGSWLLVWAAFDGEDDEIAFQWRRNGEWTAAGRLSIDNDVPDVTPRVVAWNGGASVVWSRFDGRQYRARIVDFEGGEWRDERWAAPSGSLYPKIEWLDGAPWLVYQNGYPKAWTALQLDGEEGEGLLAAQQESRERIDPLLRIDGDSMQFEWRDGEGFRASSQRLGFSLRATTARLDR